MVTRTMVRALLTCGADLRFAWRSLWRSPGFSLVAIATIALGIAGTTATFSAVDAVLLRSLPLPQADRLVWAWGLRVGGAQRASVNPLEYLDYRSQARFFSQLAAFAVFTERSTLVESGAPNAVHVGLVSGNYFDALGVAPFAGRTFTIEDERPERNHVAVLSHSAWRRLFNEDLAVVGRSVRLDDRAVMIVAVMPSDFFPPEAADVWIPMPFHRYGTNRGSHFIRPIGRLAEGVSIAAAQTELNVIAQRLEQQYPKTSEGWSLRLVPLGEQLTGGLSRSFWVVFGAAAFLLVISCANVAGLLLARSGSLAKEIAIRASLGAGRRRIMQQLLTESLLLASLSSVIGVTLSGWILKALVSLDVVSSPSWASIAVDARVIALTVPATVVVALMFGLLPALEATQVQLTDVMKATARTVLGVRPRRIRAVLIVGEVALSVVLLVGGGLFMRTLIHLKHVNPGFSVDNVGTFAIDLPEARYPQPEAVSRFFERLQQELRAISGTVAVGLVSQLPLTGQMNDVPFAIQGRSIDGVNQVTIDQRFVNADYFRAMSITIRRGRPFTPDEARRSAPVALVSERTAARFFPTEDPIGHELRILDSRYEIIGVVDDVRHRSLATDVYPTVYLPSLTNPNTNVVLRGDGSADGLGRAVRNALGSVDRDIAAPTVEQLDAVLNRSIRQPQSNALLFNGFAAFALVLALIGLYGIVAYTVNERTREIAIRIALGARDRDVIGLSSSIGVKLALMGAGLGTAIALALSRIVRGLLFGVTPVDAITYLGVAAVLVTTVMLACWIPAWRAARIEPAIAMRNE